MSPLGTSRNAAYQGVFAGLTQGEQEVVLQGGGRGPPARDATLPTYIGNYFRGQLREVEADALSDVLERQYPRGSTLGPRYSETMSVGRGKPRRLKTDHVDILMCPHGASSYAETQIPEVHETFEKLHKDGKVRAASASLPTTTPPASSGAPSRAASTRWR